MEVLFSNIAELDDGMAIITPALDLQMNEWYYIVQGCYNGTYTDRQITTFHEMEGGRTFFLRRGKF